MKNFFLFISLIIFGAQILPCKAEKVRVLTYSTLGSKGGFLKSVQDQFQIQTHCELKIETTLGASQILSYLKERPDSFDWVVGLDELLFQRGKKYWDVDPAIQSAAKKVQWNKMVMQGIESGFYLLDYGALTLIFQKEKMKELKLSPPQTASDLLKPEYKKTFILQDPRVSSPGLHFFTWLPSSISLSTLRGQALALAQSWDASYQLFTHGEAPMVWSYLSSIAYHESKGQGDQFDFVDFKEGLPLHREGMAKVKSPSSSKECSLKWFEFVYSPTIQAQLVEKQWMLPAVENTKLPPSFQKIARFHHFSNRHATPEEVDSLFARFAKEVQGEAW